MEITNINQLDLLYGGVFLCGLSVVEVQGTGRAF